MKNLFLPAADLELAAKTNQSSKKDAKMGPSKLTDDERTLIDDLGVDMEQLKSLFSGDEERFAFARALSRLSEMGSKQWVERGM